MSAAQWNGPALLVPMTVEVLTRTTVDGDGEWSALPPQYRNLGMFEPAVSGPFIDYPPSYGGQEFTGAVLHWALPDGLTRGTQPRAGGRVTYVPTPNRWLVVRKAPAGSAWTYAAWIVAADYSVASSDTNTPWLAGTSFPNAKATGGIVLGRVWPIADWPGEAAVRAHALAPPLTAIGSGLPSFAASATNVMGIFGFADHLSGVPQGPLTYSVYGWYAPPVVDPLSVGWQTVAEWQDAMTAFRWSVGTEQDRQRATAAAQTWATAHGLAFDPTDPKMQVPGRTLCHGLVFDVAWEGPNGPSVSGVPPTDSSEADYVEPQVAIGHRAADALAKLMTADEPPDKAAHFARILEAFQDDALSIVDEPDAQAQLDIRTQAGWFATAAGGSSWTVSSPRRTDDPSGEVAAAPLTPKQASLLTALNRAQRDLDAYGNTIGELQWQLFALWWKAQRLPFDTSGIDKEKVGQAIEKATKNVVHDLGRKLAGLPTLRHRRDAALVQLTATLHDLLLEQSTRPPFYRPNDPTILVTGAHRSYKHGEDGRFTADGTLFCRFTGQTVTGISAGGTIVTGSRMSLPVWNCCDLPLEVPDLDCECCFLDLGSAPAIATVAQPSDPWPLLATIRREQTLVWNSATDAALDAQTIAELAGLQLGTGGALPSKVGVQLWSPPWTPLYLDWALAYWPAAEHQPDALADWTLPSAAQPDPADDFTWQWQGKKPTGARAFTVKGRTLLTPQATVLLTARLEQLIERYAATPTAQQNLWAFQDALAYLEHADLLSQATSGFNLRLLERSPEQFSSPWDGAFASYLDPPGGPALTPDSTPFPTVDVRQFNPIRSGHAQLTDLWVVDAFGQVFDVSAALPVPLPKFPPVLGRDLVSPQEPGLLALKPRLTQFSRLSLAFVDAAQDGDEVGVVTGADPVCGWLILNHLDDSFLVYDRDGALEGEVLLTQTGAHWLPAPDRHVPSPDGAPSPVGIPNRHLRALVAELVDPAVGRGPLAALLALVDKAGWTIDPTGGWADAELPALIGRPLAVVRGRLSLELLGNEPAFVQNWTQTGQGLTEGFQDVRFPVQLGAAELHDDGLVGFYLNDDYTQIESEYVLQPPSPYVGNGRAQVAPSRVAGGAYVTLLLDPRTKVHAISGILPPLVTQLPAQFSTPALANMEITFRTGPVIDDPGPVTLELPALKQGTWSWLQYATPTTKAAQEPVAAASSVAMLLSTPPVLREGWLKLLLDGQPTLLAYTVQPTPVACTTDPDHPSVVTLVVSAYNGAGADLAIDWVAFSLPVGDGGADLLTHPELVAPRADGGTTWSVATDGKGTVAARPPKPTAVVPAGTTLRFVVAGVRVNGAAGTAPITVMEKGADKQEPRTTTISVPKVAAPR